MVYSRPLLGAALLLVLAHFAWAGEARAASIGGPVVRLDGGSIVVSAGLGLDAAQGDEIRKGVAKNIIFYVDLFRVWRNWPDEFVLGRSFARTLRCDPVRKEYVASSLSGTLEVERRFSSCGRMMEWALDVPEFALTNTAELEPAEYYVKVSAESRLRRLPPFVNMLFFFVKEREFLLEGRSPAFPVKGGGP
jgi:hypothetical protein